MYNRYTNISLTDTRTFTEDHQFIILSSAITWKHELHNCKSTQLYIRSNDKSAVTDVQSYILYSKYTRMNRRSLFGALDKIKMITINTYCN